MAADAIELFVDVSKPLGALVTGLNVAGSVTLSQFYQGSALNLRIFPVIPTGNTMPGAPYYASLSLANLDFELVVGPRAGATAILAAQYVWTKQSAPDAEGKVNYFYATLDLNTTDLNTAIGTSDRLETFIEFRMSRGAAAKAPIYQSSLAVLASVKDPGAAASVPTPTASYPTWDEIRSQVVFWNNGAIPANAGRNIILLSPNGTKTREMGVADDGSAIENAA